MHEMMDLTPLVLGILAALAVALCAAQWGAQALVWLKAMSRRDRHRAPRTTHNTSVGGQR